MQDSRSSIGRLKAAGLALAVAFAIVLAGLPRWTMPLGRDQGLFAYAGSRLLSGDALYQNVWDHKPPATHLVYAGALAIFGKTPTAVHILDLLWCLATAGAVYLVGREAFGRTAGVWAALLYGVSYQLLVGWWDSAQTDGLLLLPLTLAIYAVLRAWAGAGQPAWLMAGTCCGLAVWFKPNAAWVALAPGVATLLCRPRSAGLRRGLAFFGGFGLTVGLGLALCGLAGVLGEMLDAVVAFNLGVHVRPNFDRALLGAGILWSTRFLFKVHLLAALAGIAVLAGLWLKPRRITLLLAAWTGLSLLMAWTQWRFFGYHWVPIMAPLAVLAGRGLTWLFGWVRRRPTRTWRVIAAGGLGLAFCFSLAIYGARYGGDYVAWTHYVAGQLSQEAYLARFVRTDFDYRLVLQAAQAIAAESEPGEPVLVWGFEPLIAFLAGRQMPTRFIFTYPLLGRQGRVFRQKWRDEFLADVQTRPPALIVMGESDQNPLQPASGVECMEGWPAFRDFVASRYVWQGTAGDYRIYRRK